MATKRTSAARATAVVDSLFTTAPQNRTTAQKLADKGKQAATPPKAASPSPGRRKAAQKEAAPSDTLQQRAAEAFTGKRRALPEIAMDDLPVMDAPWMRIQETVLTIDDPEALHQELEDALQLTSALTPANLQQCLNEAETNARNAWRLYIAARVAHQAFDMEMYPVVEAMRDAANRDLQGEKDRKERSKAITDADIRGRASVLFPDEWGLVTKRQTEAEALMDTLKHFADLWKQRCFSLSTMLNAGKRG